MYIGCIANEERLLVGSHNFGYGKNFLRLKAHVDIESVICIAPVWNTTEYVHKPLALYINGKFGISCSCSISTAA